MAETEIATAGAVSESYPAVESNSPSEKVDVAASDGEVVAPDGEVAAPDADVAAPENNHAAPDADVADPDADVAAPDVDVGATEEITRAQEEDPAKEVSEDAAPEIEVEKRAEQEEKVPTAEDNEEADVALDHKRKLEESHEDNTTLEKEGGGNSVEEMNEGVLETEPKRQRLELETDGLAFNSEDEVNKLQTPPIGNGQLSSIVNVHQQPAEEIYNSVGGYLQQDIPQGGQDGSYEFQTARRIEVPSNKVGVLIGKAGETIKSLQNNSRAKIQITRDAEADPQATSRPVELLGTLDQINKAEQLIKAVIAEADAGGSPSLVARGFSAAQPGGEQIEIQVPNEKVGLIIGKGGETIRNLQTRSGARIQLIPQHLAEGDLSKERTVRVSGYRKQIDIARELINEVMSQNPRTQNLLSGYQQQSFRPHGPSTQSQWGPRGTQQSQPVGGSYDYQHRDMYPPQASQYPSQQYGGGGSYAQQPPQRSGYGGGGWEQRPVSAQNLQSGGYEYYGHNAPPVDNAHAMNAPPSGPPSMTHTGPVNYGYGQSPGYGHPSSYGQSAQMHQSYGGYDEPKYQAPSGGYPQQMGPPQTGYGQQPYGKPGYGAPSQTMMPSYGPQRMNQPGDSMYQGPSPASYPGTAPQSYPYGSNAPSQTAPTYGQSYGPAPGSMDGYHQSGGYSHHGSQAPPVYGQGGQPAPAYTQQQVAPSGSYGPYPQPSQLGYGDQQAASNASYGYQAPANDGGYGNTHSGAGYGGAPVTPQTGYSQQPTYAPGYEQQQSMPPPPPSYAAPATASAAAAGTLPTGYVKSVSPQPGYTGGVQYDSSTQMYGHQ